MLKRLHPDDLRATCDASRFKFETTAEVTPLEGIIGQDRAVHSLAFGLRMKEAGYNIYIMGATGTGRNSYTRSIVSEMARTQATPCDWCYVHDFEHPDRPRALSFPAGQGSVFRDDVASLIEQLHEHIPKAFDSEEFKTMRNEALQEFQRQSSAIMEKITVIAEKHSLLFKPTGRGFVTIPTRDGQPLNEQAMQELDGEALKAINENLTKFGREAEPLFDQIRSLEQELRDKLQNLEKNSGRSIVSPLVTSLKEKYSENKDTIDYLNELQEDILKNIKHFMPDEASESDNPLAGLRMYQQDPIGVKYRVNVFVDHKDTTGAPVIFEANSTYYNLMGMIEFQPRMGTLTTDLTKIKAGAIHRANGGYLVLQAEDLFANPFSWRALKRALKEHEAKVENAPDGSSGVISGLKPQGIPLKLKIIIIGNYEIYRLLYQYEEDFKKLFKIKVDFEMEMNREDEYLQKMAAFVSRHCKDKGYLPFHRTGVAAVFDYSSRLAENQNKLSTRFNEIVQVLAEANAWAEIEGAELVTVDHVIKALEEKRYRSDKDEQKINELFVEGTLLISVDGTEVGQINGLAVYDMGDYSFGKPSRITVNTFAGNRGVVNIEKEAQMSGRSHNKGVQILSGFLGKSFAQKHPLTLTATLTFEQSYAGVDGDSASSTELYALLSSLAEVPLRQDIAITGSVNQKGEIQPIGGVNQKIEGFFRVCQSIGLTGKQGVLIPPQNVKNLMLHAEVVEAVKNGRFHIHTADTIADGIELLAGMPAGELDADGVYPEGTLYRLVADKLAAYHSVAARYIDTDSS